MERHGCIGGRQRGFEGETEGGEEGASVDDFVRDGAKGCQKDENVVCGDRLGSQSEVLGENESGDTGDEEEQVNDDVGGEVDDLSS